MSQLGTIGRLIRARYRRARRTLYVTLSRLRPYALAIAGLGSLAVAGFQVGAWLGWTVLGLGFLVLEWRVHER